MKIRMSHLLACDCRGTIIDIPHLEAAGMKGGLFFRLDRGDLIRLPPTSCLYMLPDRLPVGYDPQNGNFITAGNNLYAVAAFLSPGFTATHSAAYREASSHAMLPLFSYAAVSFYRGGYYAAAIRVDRDRRHDTRFIDIRLVKKNIFKFKKIFPKNRLIRHLENCALVYCCPGAQNFFLGRYEGPLPVSPSCNAGCAGCISYQAPGGVPSTQPRIRFIPTPQDVAEAAVFHIANVRDPVVSFGQGCEGEPLLAGEIIERSIRLIRAKTSRGVININTNASRPRVISRLLDAGLNSMRVSLNSAREIYYTRYYKPKDYTFGDVLGSIKIAKEKGAFVSINYLTMPGFTDSRGEFEAVKQLIASYRINMIQWRNLNFDPFEYFRRLDVYPRASEMLGVREVMNRLKKRYPRLRMGYFNPSTLRHCEGTPACRQAGSARSNRPGSERARNKAQERNWAVASLARPPTAGKARSQ